MNVRNLLNYYEAAAIPVCLVLFLGLLLLGSTLPFVGYNAWNFNTYSLIAHNFVVFGYLPLKIAPIISVSDYLPATPLYYLNHPQLLSLLISIVFRLFGESFFTARIINIFSSASSALLLYYIVKKVGTIQEARVALIIGVLIPAASVFGKMIGQESLLLAFVLFSVYSFLRYEDSKEIRWLIASLVSIALGTLTDWPMVYFSLSFALYAISRKRKKEAFLIIGVSILAALFFLYYVFLLTGSFSFLFEGFLNRSMGQLFRDNAWAIFWPLTVVTRLLLYFNPVFVFASFLFFLNLQKRNRRLIFLSISLLLFGVLHILLYPEGSFGHPYWMYYLVPCICIPSAFVLNSFEKKRKSFVVGIFAVSFLFVFIVNYWKVREIEGNVFRFTVANQLSTYIPVYSQIWVNRNGFIDPDLLAYRFLYKVKIDDSMGKDIVSTAKWYVFSCIASCHFEGTSRKLADRYSSIVLKGKDLEVWLFDLSGSKRQKMVIHDLDAQLPDSSHSYVTSLYRYFLSASKAPQL